MTGGLLVAGTTSDAGKSTIVAGICRWLHRQGVRVAPFKALNMSNNSAVVLDATGRAGEIGRAQASQAMACGLVPSARFNPVLLKPGSDMRGQVVLNGVEYATLGAHNVAELRPVLAEAAYAAFDDLRRDFDVVICEGAGSPTEINSRAGDFVNMGLARYGNLPVVVVGDIDRGGVLASFHGTVALLSAPDQALVGGFIVNKFRGHADLLMPGLDALRTVAGRPTLGVVPWHPDLWLDTEDSLSGVDGRIVGHPDPPHGTRWLRIAAVRLPRLSNATDLEALACEPGVVVRLTTSPAELVDADLIVLPGSKSTVDDLKWLRDTGLAAAVVAHVRAGRPVLGICGGFQMLGRVIHDDVESGHGRVEGLGLLPIEVTFAREKTLAHVEGTGFGGVPVRGYEIHHGYVSDADPALPALIATADGDAEGAARDGVYGTHWHGVFESDAFRRAFLRDVARRADRNGFAVAPDVVFADRRARMLDLVGDLVAEHLDTTALLRLIEYGAPAGLPFVPPGMPDTAPVPLGIATFDDVVREVLRREPRLGGVRLVAVDGPSGAGKTTFAARLERAMSRRVRVAVVHTDELLDGWDDPISVWPRLRSWVLDPLANGQDGAIRVYDWTRTCFGTEWYAVGVPDVLIVEGVTSACAEIRATLSYAVFVTAEPALRFRRALERDGTAVEAPLRAWQAAENRYFDAERTVDHVDLAVDGGAPVGHDPNRELVRLI